MPGLSVPAFTSVPVPELFTIVPRSSAAIPESSAAMPGSSIAVPESLAVMPGLSATLLGSFILTSASALLPGLSALVPLFTSTPVFPGSSPLLFLALFLSKTPIPSLAAKKRRLDDTISGWSGKSKRASLKEL